MEFFVFFAKSFFSPSVKKRTPFPAVFRSLFPVVDRNGENLHFTFAHVFVPQVWTTEVVLAISKFVVEKILGDPSVIYTTRSVTSFPSRKGQINSTHNFPKNRQIKKKIVKKGV